MQKLLLILTILLALILITLVISLPRENQQFFSETRSTIGKSGYWETNFFKKVIDKYKKQVYTEFKFNTQTLKR